MENQSLFMPMNANRFGWKVVVSYNITLLAQKQLKSVCPIAKDKNKNMKSTQDN